jgi:hypothetical protein
MGKLAPMAWQPANPDTLALGLRLECVREDKLSRLCHSLLAAYN